MSNGPFNVIANPFLTEISGFHGLTQSTGINGNVRFFQNNGSLNVCKETYNVINSAKGSNSFTDSSTFTINPC